MRFVRNPCFVSICGVLSATTTSAFVVPGKTRRARRAFSGVRRDGRVSASFLAAGRNDDNGGNPVSAFFDSFGGRDEERTRQQQIDEVEEESGGDGGNLVSSFLSSFGGNANGKSQEIDVPKDPSKPIFLSVVGREKEEDDDPPESESASVVVPVPMLFKTLGFLVFFFGTLFLPLIVVFGPGLYKELRPVVEPLLPKIELKAPTLELPKLEVPKFGGGAKEKEVADKNASGEGTPTTEATTTAAEGDAAAAAKAGEDGNPDASKAETAVAASSPDAVVEKALEKTPAPAEETK